MHIRHLNKTDIKNIHLLKRNPTCHHNASIKYALPFWLIHRINKLYSWIHMAGLDMEVCMNSC